MNKIYQKPFPSGKNAGFTLIELLVVVLIIGILSAVALPQYQVAVAKSRISALIPLMRSLQLAQERYYLENGVYAASLKDLDIGCGNWGTGARENWCYFDAKGTARAHSEGYYIVVEDSRVKDVLLLYFLTKKPTASCYAYNGGFADKVCRGISGRSTPTGGWSGVNIYQMF